MDKQPLISCICVTKGHPLKFQRAIACFERQEYINRELIISYAQNDTIIKQLIERVRSISDIRLIEVQRPTGEELDSATNNAIAAANGDYICIWQEEDWSGSRRLTIQYAAIEDGLHKACVLQNILRYDSLNFSAYFSSSAYWEGTLFSETKAILNLLNGDTVEDSDSHLLALFRAGGQLLDIPYASDSYICMQQINLIPPETIREDVFMGENSSKILAELVSLDYYQL